ncbi:MAG: fibronectin type III domain-containing protein, partial [Bacteroidetes bacterium]|nr:fibronectin type III domain-containing protein [Bacteroidota bacterium]
EVLKAEMMKTLTSLVDDLNYNHNGLITWGANAGLPVVEERNKPVTEILPPANIRAIPQAVAGELELRYTLPSAKWVRITGLEYSEDDGKTWQNGSYSSKTVMKVKGLPSGKSVLIRLRAIGAGQRSSSWSNALKLFLI